MAVLRSLALSLSRFLGIVLFAVWGAFAPVTGPAVAQQLPDDLQGDWGTPGQCEAQQTAGPDATVDHIMDAPYRFQGQWISRWFHYCRVRQFDPITAGPLEGGYRVWAMCGEDAVERPWQIEIAREDDTLSLTWHSLDPDDPVSVPWRSGPFQRCPAESS